MSTVTTTIAKATICERNAKRTHVLLHNPTKLSALIYFEDATTPAFILNPNSVYECQGELAKAKITSSTLSITCTECVTE
jgi:hypothetical protein